MTLSFEGNKLNGILDTEQTPRLRSEGVLSAHDVSQLRVDAVPMSYDPVQVGWVPAACQDDLNEYKAQQKFSIIDVYFRDWTATDAIRYSEILSRPEVWTYMPEGYPGPISDIDAIGLIEAGRMRRDHVVKAVEYEGRVVGQVRLKKADDAGTAEVSYWLDPDEQGNGIGRTMVRRFLKHCFAEQPSTQRIVAKVHKDNPASQKVAMNAGLALAHIQSDQEWLIFEKTRS